MKLRVIEQDGKDNKQNIKLGNLLEVNS